MDIEELKCITLAFENLKTSIGDIEIAPSICKMEGEVLVDSCIVYFVKEHKDVFLNLLSESSINKFKELLDQDFRFTDLAFGIVNSSVAEILLYPLHSIVSISEFISAELVFKYNYEGSIISAKILEAERTKNGYFIYDHLWASRYREVYILELSGLDALDASKVNSIIPLIANSLLFDISVTYKIPLAYFRNEELSRFSDVKFFKPDLITNRENKMVLKKYNEELLSYYNTAIKIAYPPFQYLCLYQILEYHLDRSAFLSAKEKINNLISKPDFHSKQDEYIVEAVNFIKSENKSINHDKAKLDRVIDQFVESARTKEDIQLLELKSHFENDIEIICKKTLVLKSIDFDGKFKQTVKDRIYSMRCSIVHSNPDFEKSHAIPFLPTRINLELLRKEIQLVKSIAEQIIANPKSYDD